MWIKICLTNYDILLNILAIFYTLPFESKIKSYWNNDSIKNIKMQEMMKIFEVISYISKTN